MDTEPKDETARFETSISDVPEVAEVKTESASAEDKSEIVKTDIVEESADSGESATAEQDDGKNEGDKPELNKRRSAQKRIDKVVREREDAKRRAEVAEKRLSEIEEKSKVSNDKEPVENDFDTYDEYLDAVDKFDQSAKDPEPSKKSEAPADIESELTGSQKTAMALIKEKVDQDSERYPNFEKVALNPEIPITGEMLEALAECEDPSKVMMQLGNNAELAAEISGKSPAQQMREIVKLDLMEEKPVKPTKTTNASAPITPVHGSDAQEKKMSDMSFSEYEEKMNKAELKRGNNW